MCQKLRLALFAVVVTCGPADAQRFAERTPPPRASAVAPAWPADGVPPLARYVRPSTSLKLGVGTIHGTFGYDYVNRRPGRVFLTPSVDPSRGPSIARAYRTDPVVTYDPIALRPVRKAVIAAKGE